MAIEDLGQAGIPVPSAQRVNAGQSYIIDEMDRASLTTAAVGSAGYIPSEVLADPKHRSPLQDIFACGVILYEILASRRPDPAEYQVLSVIAPELGNLDKVVRRALAPATGRYQTAADFRDELRVALTSI